MSRFATILRYELLVNAFLLGMAVSAWGIVGIIYAALHYPQIVSAIVRGYHG